MTCNTTTTTTTTNAFGKTICSICYEDLKPLVEDLQSISICGHVFHELCLQQWMEYCVRAKKSTCPVCKQRCTQENIGRLYFQSIGDSNECTQQPQRSKVLDHEGDTLLLNIELSKLNGKLSAQTAVFERQQQDLKELKSELCACKDELNKEAAFKNEALQRNASIQQLLRAKTEEFVKMSLECSKLQERNMALAKELAALKLVSDLNLDEDEVLKLASFGHGSNSKDTVDVLKKSLVHRNQSYKELMVQCNRHGREGARSKKKLEKAQEKMKNLKTRVKELELAIEEKDNRALRELKASRKSSCKKRLDPNGVKLDSNSSFFQNYPSEDNQKEPSIEPMITPDSKGGRTNQSEVHKDVFVKSREMEMEVIDVDREDFNLFKGEDSSVPPPSMVRPSFGFLGTCSLAKKGISNGPMGAVEKDVIQNVTLSSVVEASDSDEVEEIPSLLHNIRKENSIPLSTPKPGDQSFARGFLGPDGSSTYLGKWCKKNASRPSSSAMQGSSTGSGDLIATGPDGRGGTIKVSRSLNHVDVKGGSFLAKKLKKKPIQQSQGFRQIDQFFVKAERP